MFWLWKLIKRVARFGFKTLFLIAALATWLIGCGIGHPGIGSIGFLALLFYVFVLWNKCRDWWIGKLYGTTKKGKQGKKKKETTKTKKEKEDDDDEE